MSSSKDTGDSEGKKYSLHSKKAFVSPSSSPEDEEAADKVLRVFRSIMSGYFDSVPWQNFEISAVQYHKLRSLLKQDRSLGGFVQDKIRYDYDTVRRCISVRMPTVIHYMLADYIIDNIKDWLKETIKAEGPASLFASNIYHEGSVDFDVLHEHDELGKRGIRMPDGQMAHLESEYPSVVVEVKYSNKSIPLIRLAESYLHGSNNSVQVVIGIEVDYRKRTRKATVSAWRLRPGVPNPEIYNAVKNNTFRDDDGNFVDQGGINLSLHDLAPKDIVQKELGDFNDSLNISVRGLYDQLSLAEKKYAMKMARRNKARRNNSGDDDGDNENNNDDDDNENDDGNHDENDDNNDIDYDEDETE